MRDLKKDEHLASSERPRCPEHSAQGQKDAPGPRYSAKEIISLIQSAKWEKEYMDAESDSYIAFITSKLKQMDEVGGSPARSVEARPEGKLPNYDTPEEMVDHIVGMVADDGSISPYARDLAIDYIETRLKYAALPGSLPVDDAQYKCNKCHRQIKWSFGYWRDDNAQSGCVVNGGLHELKEK